MKIRMKQGISGADFSLSPGDETERFSEAEAGRLIASGVAEAVTAPAAPKRERATKKRPAETRG